MIYINFGVVIMYTVIKYIVNINIIIRIRCLDLILHCKGYIILTLFIKFVITTKMMALLLNIHVK